MVGWTFGRQDVSAGHGGIRGDRDSTGVAAGREESFASVEPVVDFTEEGASCVAECGAAEVGMN